MCLIQTKDTEKNRKKLSTTSFFKVGKWLCCKFSVEILVLCQMNIWNPRMQILLFSCSWTFFIWSSDIFALRTELSIVTVILFNEHRSWLSFVTRIYDNVDLESLVVDIKESAVCCKFKKCLGSICATLYDCMELVTIMNCSMSSGTKHVITLLHLTICAKCESLLWKTYNLRWALSAFVEP